MNPLEEIYEDIKNINRNLLLLETNPTGEQRVAIREFREDLNDIKKSTLHNLMKTFEGD